MSTDQPLRFPYAWPMSRMLGMIAVSIALPCVFAYLAVSNHQGLRLLGLVRLTPSQATAFYWGAFFLCLMAACAAVWFGARNLCGPQRYVEFRPTYVVVPQASLSQGMVSVPYSSIRQIQIAHVGGQRMVVIRSTAGESRLSSVCFTSEGEFNSFMQSLQERAGG